jgi:imidazolonepropionase-like amidohydrolase
MTGDGGLILNNCLVFDGLSADLAEGRHILIRQGLIEEISDRDIRAADIPRIDVKGRIVMPGLIDAHYHAYAADISISAVDRMPPALRVLHARALLEASLMRGFTTVRDAAGGDIGLAQATEQGLIRGPRFFFSGKAISQTGGHGDMRAGDQVSLCGCGGYHGAMTLVVDGADEVRKAVREELRQGATQIKIFVSGGIASPSDPIWMNQLTDAEIQAAVEEAATRRTYVMAHAHTAEAVIRSVRNGVRSVEHATIINDAAAKAIATAGAFAVPTLVVLRVFEEQGAALGLSPAMMAKVREVGQHALSSLELLRANGVKIGFGTDLLGKLGVFQSREFSLRREVMSPLDILRSATSVNAGLLNMTGKLGAIAPGANADLLVVEGNPLINVATLENHDNLRLIVKAGQIYKNSLP